MHCRFIASSQKCHALIIYAVLNSLKVIVRKPQQTVGQIQQKSIYHCANTDWLKVLGFYSIWMQVSLQTLLVQQCSVYKCSCVLLSWNKFGQFSGLESFELFLFRVLFVHRFLPLFAQLIMVIFWQCVNKRSSYGTLISRQQKKLLTQPLRLESWLFCIFRIFSVSVLYSI